MRLSALIFAALLPVFGAAAQTPPAEKTPPVECRFETETGALVTSDKATCNALVQEMLTKGNLNRPVGSLPLSCRVDDSEIVAEQKASDQKLKEMTRRGEVIPLQHQYEQELYYKERFAKALEAKCGKAPAAAPDREFGARAARLPLPDMTLRACRAIAPDCQPRKHW